ncbi:hypothetical protein YPF_3983 [Yersinia pestis biovar Orientalis str. India 195]|nr:hypothetical protein YPF_3983 [Yersinia pestis biovar Orientalis str. India 195]EEO85341.1 hypothetical protein YPH_1200 [Yersinia pestis biovar Orientalis str. PEXU2]
MFILINSHFYSLSGMPGFPLPSPLNVILYKKLPLIILYNHTVSSLFLQKIIE